MRDGFTYRRNATRADVRALVADISPMERAPADVLGRLLAALRHSRTYVVRLGGRLAGICFVADLPCRREMAFTKTAWLTGRRPVAFARGIPRLFADLNAHEAETGHDGRPMFMHVPEGDAKSAAWFVRAGCATAPDGTGLLCPTYREVPEWALRLR